VELYRGDVAAVSGNGREGDLDKVVVDLAGEVGNGQADRNANGCPKKNLAQEITEHLQRLHPFCVTL